MTQSNVQHIKRSQKESLLLKELSKMLHHLSLDDSTLMGLTINRIQLSRDKSICIVYFYDTQGAEIFHQKLKQLILYKPAIRKGIAAALQSRYVPNIKFAYDKKFEKQQRLESLIEQAKKELPED